MNRILFVDDEPGILQGLRNSLRKYRDRWEMVFVPGGADALQEMAKAPFEVIISDMRMPNMDGAELLARVKRDYPATARIVLSGHAEQEAILRALPSAQQYLSKPCPSEQLQQVIERACSVNSLLNDDKVREVVGGLTQLPSMPRTYLELSRAMAHPDVRLADIVAIVERDPAMSAKVLQLVNSAYFGHGSHTGSIRGAITYLGLDLLKGLALSTHVFGAAESSRSGGLGLQGVQDHSLKVANLLLRLINDPKRADEAFTVALVHDVGRIILAGNFAEQYAAVTDRVRRTGVPCSVAEQEVFGVSHCEVGAYLLGRWGLPITIVEAVAHHHRPRELSSAAATELLAMLHLADGVSLDPSDAGAGGGTLDLEFLQDRGFAADVPRARRIAEELAQDGR